METQLKKSALAGRHADMERILLYRFNGDSR
jgi:hypothetical protein